MAIAQGRIAAVEANIAGDAAETIDAKGKLVVPGLIDIHTHAAHVKDGPAMCLADGVTGLIDAGSQGADHISDTHRYRQSAPQICRVLINIGRARQPWPKCLCTRAIAGRLVHRSGSGLATRCRFGNLPHFGLNNVFAFGGAKWFRFVLHSRQKWVRLVFCLVAL